MKRRITKLTSFIILIAILVQFINLKIVYGADNNIILKDNIYFELMSQNEIKNINKIYEYSLPTNKNYLKVTGIKNNVSKLTIPEKVMINGKNYYVIYIGAKSFYKSSLLEIKIPDSIIMLGTGCFAGSNKLKEISISKNCLKIGDSAFYMCKALRTVDFKNCTELRIIGNASFADTAITKLELPDRLKRIDQSAFFNCTSLKSVYIGENVNEILPGVFAYCNNIEKVIIDSNNKNYSIINGVIYNKDNYAVAAPNVSANLTLDEKTVKISGYCFEGNNKIKNIILNDNLKEIEEGAFNDCNKLSSIKINAKLNKFSANVFGYCYKLKDIIVSKDNKYFSSKNGILFSKNKDKLIAYPSALGNITIPASVKTICKWSFLGAEGLKELTIGKQVKVVESGAFFSCSNLKNVKIMSSKTDFSAKDSYKSKENNIKYECGIFYGCKENMKVKLPQSCKNDKNYKKTIRRHCPMNVSFIFN